VKEVWVTEMLLYVQFIRQRTEVHFWSIPSRNYIKPLYLRLKTCLNLRAAYSRQCHEW